MSNDPHRQGQQLPPPPWSSSQPPPPPPSQYPVHPTQLPYQYPPPHGSHPDMAAIQPQMQQHPHQEPYRLPPPPPGPYQRPPEVYPPPPPAAPPVVYQAAAPRQRTAIACRYCRRRKIRCSGFDTSQDGRCSNCVRFNQDCMFTPVSSQTQAFVPAHAAYPHLRGQTGGRGGPRVAEGVTLYGAHGQPLPQQGAPPHHSPEHTLPPPPGMYQQQQPPPPYGRPPVDDRGAPLPPGHPQAAQDPHQSQDPRDRYDYHHGPTLPPVSTSGPGYPPQASPSPSSAHYYSGSPQDRRLSSQSSFHEPTASAAPFSSLQAPTSQPGAESGVTPPPSQQPSGSGRSGLSVRDMLGPPAETPSTRSSTDSDMLNALNRRGLKQ